MPIVNSDLHPSRYRIFDTREDAHQWISENHPGIDPFVMRVDGDFIYLHETMEKHGVQLDEDTVDAIEDLKFTDDLPNRLRKLADAIEEYAGVTGKAFNEF